MLPDVVVLRPRVVAELAGTGNRVERPLERSVVRVVRLDAAADAVLGAGKAGDDESVVVQRRAGNGVALFPPLGLDRPRDRAGALIERQQLAVQLADEHLPLAEANAAARPPAADGVDLFIELRFVSPESRTGLDRDRKHIVCTGDDVDDAVV